MSVVAEAKKAVYSSRVPVSRVVGERLDANLIDIIAIKNADSNYIIDGVITDYGVVKDFDGVPNGITAEMVNEGKI
ncbi:MAG: hypothetical protein CMI29_04820 [Opitutae bacterium]|nr:hypothetical protein [Opitutae bacterium]